jgi:hypothetical protein
MPHGRALVGVACGFFLFNLVLKLPGAGQASLWLDEAFTIFGPVTDSVQREDASVPNGRDQ